MFDNDKDESMFNEDGDRFAYADREEENLVEIDFYDVLNVPRDASMEEIHKAYKQKCLIFHPDKQLNLSDVDREKVDKAFAELQWAHKILMDPCMRRIYDVMGVRGTNLEGWQLVDHLSTAENIRKEYDFLCRLRDNKIMLQMVNPQSNLFAKFSLIGCFQEVDRYGPELIGMGMGQNVDFVIVGSHKIGIGGTTRFNEKGMGDGTVQLRHKWAHSLSFQQEITISTSPDMVQLSSAFTFANNSPGSFLHRYSIVIEPILRYSASNSSLSPSISTKMIAPLLPGWRGVLALNFPHGASISLLNFTVRNRPQFFINLQLSAVGFPSARLVYHKYYADCHWIVQTHLSPREITPSLSYDRRLSQHLRVAFNVKLSYPSFLLQSSIKITTNLSTFEFFFVLCDDQVDFLQSFVKGIVLPLIAFNTARFIYRQMRNGAKKPGQ